MTVFQQTMRMCDDCDRTDMPLAWFNENIRICERCRSARLAAPLDERAGGDDRAAGMNPKEGGL